MESALEARLLRGERIPQLVGMSVAAKVLAAELSRALLEEAKQLCNVEQLQENLQIDGSTAERLAPLLAACQVTIAQNVAQRCMERADTWLATAHRAEGRATALEETLGKNGEARAAEK